MTVRPIVAADVPALKVVLDNCTLFPSEYLDSMIANYLQSESTDEIWFTVEHEGVVISIAYCAPMQLTNGTYNLYAIGVDESWQAKGVGTRMMRYIEEKLRNDGHRILIVETSSTPAQSAARAFYIARGYTEEARIRHFWDHGDHKVVYWKQLHMATN